ncbi:hypothetical protein N9O57_01535 [bacterium]|nr:hypothetical protein [bacterium]
MKKILILLLSMLTLKCFCLGIDFQIADAIDNTDKYQKWMDSNDYELQVKALEALHEDLISATDVKNREYYYKYLQSFFIETQNYMGVKVDIAITLVGMKNFEITYSRFPGNDLKLMKHEKVLDWLSDEMSISWPFEVLKSNASKFEKHTAWALILFRAEKEYAEYEGSSLTTNEFSQIINQGLELLCDGNMIGLSKEYIIDSLLSLAMHWNHYKYSGLIINKLLEHSDDEVKSVLLKSFNSRVLPMINLISLFPKRTDSISYFTSLVAVKKEIIPVYDDFQYGEIKLSFIHKQRTQKKAVELIHNSGLRFILETVAKINSPEFSSIKNYAKRTLSNMPQNHLKKLPCTQFFKALLK